MKLITYSRNGISGFGAVVNNSIVDLAGKFPNVENLASLLAEPGLVEEARAYVSGVKGDFALDDVQLEPVIPTPGKVLCWPQLCGSRRGGRAESWRISRYFPALRTNSGCPQRATGSTAGFRAV